MFDFTYETQGVNTYLVYTVPDDMHIDTLAKGMISNNNISGIANTLFTQTNEIRYVKFNITSLISLKHLLSSAVNCESLISIFCGSANTMIEIEDYLLDYKMLLLDLDHIYVNAVTKETTMIYMPIQQGDDCITDAYAFFRDVFMNRVKLDADDENFGFTKIFNYLSNADSFSLPGFKVLLTDIKAAIHKSEPISQFAKTDDMPKKSVSERVVINEPQKNYKIEPVQVVSPVSPEPVYPVNEIKEKKKNIIGFLHKKSKNEQDDGKGKNSEELFHSIGFAVPGMDGGRVEYETNSEHGAHNSGGDGSPIGNVGKDNYSPVQSGAEITVYGFQGDENDEGTIVDLEKSDLIPKANNPYLLRRKTNEIIFINKPEFKIGRNSSFNDYNVKDNQYVGHTHCHIVAKNGGYYVVDDNSKNHTFIDDAVIAAGTENAIIHGQILRLGSIGKEEFEFRLY